MPTTSPKTAGHADVGADRRRCDWLRTLSPGAVRFFLSSTVGSETTARGYCIGGTSGRSALWCIPGAMADIRIIVVGPLMMTHFLGMAGTDEMLAPTPVERVYCNPAQPTRCR